MTIRNKLILSIASIVIAIIAVYTGASYLAQRHLLLQALDEKLLCSVENLQGGLPVDYHDRIVNSGSVSPEEYAGIVDKNDRLCLNYGLQYLWSCMQMGDQVVFTTATSPSKDVAKRDYAPFFSAHADPHAFDKAFETMKPVFGSFQNEWGRGRMVLLPGRDRSGRAYCFGASVSVDAIHSELNKTLRHSIYLGMGFLLIGMLVSFLVSNTLAQPIVRLTGIADEIARGKMGQPIGTKGPAEILSLGRSLAAMDRSIRQTIGELESDREKLRLLSGALEAAANAVFITDKEGMIVWVNTAFTTFTGYSATEAIGKRPSLLKSGKQDHEFYKKLWETILNGEVWCSEIINRRKEGSLYPEEITITPMKDSRGEITHFIAVTQDITERKQARETLEQRVAERTEELRRSEEQYRMLFEASRDAIITTDSEGNSLDCNRAAVEMFGFADKRTLLALGPGGLSPEFQPDGRTSREAFAEVLSQLRDKGSLFVEWQHQRADGTSFPVEVALSLFHVAGQPILHGMLRDITERKRAEAVVLQNMARAEELARLKSRFVSMASHELRTPLANIMLACELLKNFGNEIPAERSRSVLSGLVTGVSSMVRTLDDLLLAGKIEEGKLPFTPVPFALLDFLERRCKEVQPELPSRIEIAFHDAGLNVAADERLLGHILQNFLENALKYSPAGTKVELGVEVGADSLTLSVLDRGIGVPEAERKFLFEAFSRASNVGDKPGSGLGLFIAQKCAQAHGGRLRYTPQPDGSIFSVTIPATTTGWDPAH